MPNDLALRYMTRYRCIGPACENHCCWGWNVDIDEDNYEKVRQATRNDPVERRRLRKAMRPVPKDDRKPNRFARIVMTLEGSCPLYRDDGLCHVQATYGATYLCHTCAFYPRRLHQFGEDFELTGVVSCCEVARQLLLYPDSTDWVPFDRALLPRTLLAGGCHPRDSRPYWRHLRAVRATVTQLMAVREHSLTERLFFMAYLGKRTASLLNTQCLQGSPAEVDEHLRFISDRAVQAAIAQRFQNLTTPSSLVVLLAKELLRVGSLKRTRTSLRELTWTVLGSYGAKTGPAEKVLSSATTGSEPRASKHEAPEPLPELPTADLWARYQERRDRLLAAAGPRIDQYIGNFVVHYWAHRWHLESPDLLVHSLRLLTELAVVKFLLFSHPRVQSLPDGPDGLAELDRVAVEVFHKTASFIEHSGLLQQLERALERNGLNSLAGAVYLARF